MSTTLRSRTLIATSTSGRDTIPEIKTKTRRFKEESRPDGQHSPSTAISSRVTLKMLEETSLQLMRTSSNDIRCGYMGTHHPCKEQASSRTNKDGKAYYINVKHHIQGQKTNIWIREKTKVTDAIEQIRRRKWAWAGHIRSARYEITDGHCASPPGNNTKGKDLEEDRRDIGETH